MAIFDNENQKKMNVIKMHGTTFVRQRILFPFHNGLSDAACMFSDNYSNDYRMEQYREIILTVPGRLKPQGYFLQGCKRQWPQIVVNVAKIRSLLLKRF